MTAAVAPPSPLLLHEPQESSALARKRRREILQTHRAASIIPDPAASSAVVVASAVLVSATVTEVPVPKKPKLCTSSDAMDAQSKKPQMKYDPEVPMTKEDAAVWRREQRRKRNRESAAASRQRQRDRIYELEVEMDGWKTKYSDVLAKIASIEQCRDTDDLIDSLPLVSGPSVMMTSFLNTKIPLHEPYFCAEKHNAVSEDEEEQQESHLIKISRQA
jgi:bZIP transcription factor